MTREEIEASELSRKLKDFFLKQLDDDEERERWLAGLPERRKKENDEALSQARAKVTELREKLFKALDSEQETTRKRCPCCGSPVTQKEDREYQMCTKCFCTDVY